MFYTVPYVRHSAICDKAVYATEKMIVDDASKKNTIHKTCFKCKTCGQVGRSDNVFLTNSKCISAFEFC